MRDEVSLLNFALYETNIIAKLGALNLGAANLVKPRTVIFLRKQSPGTTHPLFAEIAPLPGFSGETLDSIFKSLQNKTIPEHRPPSLAWGIENFIGAHDLSIANVYQEWSWLIPRGEPVAQIAMLEMLSKKNVRTVKIKTEPESLAALLEYLARIELPNSFRIRLDANNEFSAASIKTLQGFANKSLIEFIEDPFPFSEFKLWQNLSNHFALATNAVPSPCERKSFYADLRIAYVSLKPSLIGSGSQIAELCREFRSYELKILYSSLMETDLGTYAIHNFSKLFPGDTKPGLGVSHLFQPKFSFSHLLESHALDWQAFA